MKLSDISPIFLTNLQHKIFCYSGHDKLQIVKLQCINDKGLKMNFNLEEPRKTLVKGEIYWAYEDTSSNYWYYDNHNGYPIYKIFLPILGCRKYDPKRFKVLDKLIIYKADFLLKKK